MEKEKVPFRGMDIEIENIEKVPLCRYRNWKCWKKKKYHYAACPESPDGRKLWLPSFLPGHPFLLLLHPTFFFHSSRHHHVSHGLRIKWWYKDENWHIIPFLWICNAKNPYLGSEMSIIWKSSNVKDLTNIMSVFTPLQKASSRSSGVSPVVIF